MVNILTKELFEKEVLVSSLPVIIDVYAPWCGPCKVMMPVFEEVSSLLEGKALFYKLNIEDDRSLAVQFQIASIPTVLFFKGGVLQERFVGSMGKETMLGKIQLFLSKNI